MESYWLQVLCIPQQRYLGGCVRVSGALKILVLLVTVAAAFFVLGYFVTMGYVS